MRKLSGWKRIGIVASVIWAVGGFLWVNYNEPSRYNFILEGRSWCMSHPDYTMNAAQCDVEYTKMWNEATKNIWQEAVVFALVPIPFGWIIIGGLFGVARWIRTGFVS